MKRMFGLLVVLVMVFGAVASTHATLILRGQGTSVHGTYNLIYDDDLDITWYDYTSSYATWQDQVNWADALTVAFNGTTYDDWRLPSTVDGDYEEGYEGPNPDGSYSYTAGYNLYNSEMGHLYYTELGNLGWYDTTGWPQSGWGLNNTDNFQNLIADFYWSDTEYSAIPGLAWYFSLEDGFQSISLKDDGYLALAVRSGDVAAPIPEPGTILLLGSGLVGLAASRKRLGRHG